MKNDLDEIFGRLARSRFRQRFKLQGRERAYAEEHDRAELDAHTRDLLSSRLFVAEPRRDGKQTPYRGHPVFVAQHATGTCCRGCLEKWHGIERGRPLTGEEQDYVVGVIRTWIDAQLAE